MNEAKRNSIITYLSEQKYESDIAHTKRVADLLKKKIFVFDNPWDLEAYPEPMNFMDGIVWGETPNGDPEFIWQMNRHRNLMALGQAYALTKDESYAAAFEEIIADWIRKVPLNEENKSKGYRSLEAGFRGDYLSKAILYFVDSETIKESTWTLICESVDEHINYLLADYTPKKKILNWGIIEANGLFGFAVLKSQLSSDFSLNDGMDVINTAYERLSLAAKLQVMKDGSQWEQSPLYHNEVLHCFLDVLAQSRQHGLKVPEDITQAAARLAYAQAISMKPDGKCFLHGDSDDMDMRSALAAAAWLLNEPKLKFFAGEVFDYELVWELGSEAALMYEQMKAETPDFLSAALSDSGNYYLRSGYEKRANLLHFHCGTMGASHGHFDKLHFDLVMDGRDVLVDSGRFSYMFSNGRVDFKGGRAHNTIIVNGTDLGVCKDSWEYEKLGLPLNRGIALRRDSELVYGGHLGFMDMGVYVNRKIIYIRPDIYVIADEIYGSSEMSCEAFYHFSEKGTITVNGNEIIYGDDIGEVFMYTTAESSAIETAESSISRHYNRKASNPCIKITKKGDSFVSFFTVISKHKVQVGQLPVKSVIKDTFYSENMAEAIKISGNNQSHTVAVCHKEVMSPADMIKAGECEGMGNVIVWKEEHKTGETLLW